MLNYLIRIPTTYRDKCAAFFASTPATVRLWGIHLRFHYANFFFVRTINDVLALVIPFCRSRLAERPTVFALATDSQELFNSITRQIVVVSAPVWRTPDIDQQGALTDMTMLMMCQEFLFTARSTFSSLVGMRVGKRAWVIERNAQEIYMLSHSQVCHHQTPLFLWMPRWKAFDMTAIAAMGGAEQQRVLASYYRYFVL
jgi:hypothetical protein